MRRWIYILCIKKYICTILTRISPLNIGGGTNGKEGRIGSEISENPPELDTD